MKITSLAILFLILSAFAYGAEYPPDERGLNSVVNLSPHLITASRLLGNNTTSDEILENDAIGAFNADTILDSLDTLTAAWIVQPGGGSGFPSLFVRGADPNLTQIRVDGVRVNDINDARGGSANFALLDPVFVQRMALVPGGVSATQGSSAMSGLLQIESGLGDRKTSLFGDVGENGYYRVGGAGSFSWNGTNLLAGLSLTDFGEPFKGSRLELLRGSLGFDRQWKSNWQVRTRIHFSETKAARFPDDSGGPELAVIRELEREESNDILASIHIGREFGESNRIALDFGYYRRDSRIESPGIAPGQRDPFGVPATVFDTELKSFNAVIYTQMSLTDRTEWVIGAECFSENGDSDSLLNFDFFSLPGTYALERETYSGFIELGHQLFPHTSLNLSLRYDDYDGVDTQWSPSLAVTWDISPLSIDIRRGSGFKLPSFFALGNPFVGNPDLKPEQSDTYELRVSAELVKERLQATVSIFRNDYENLIDFIPGPPPQLVNLSQVQIEGIELSLKAKVSDHLDVRSSFTFLHSEIPGQPGQLLDRPEQYAHLGLHYRPNDTWDVWLRGRYTGSRLASSIPTGDQILDDYFLLDLGISFRITKAGKLRLSFLNLTNSNYQTAVGYPGLDRQVRMGTQWTF